MTEKTIHSPGKLLPVLFLGVLMAALDIAIVGPALPAIRETFGLSERAIAWVFNVFVLFNLVGLPLMARLSDVFGRRIVYTCDVLLFGAGSLLVALSPSFEVLLVGRGIQGVAASGIFPVASAVVGDVFPPERRGRVLGVLGAVFGLAFIVGPLLASWILTIGWPWLFGINIPLAVFVAGMGYRLLPTTRSGASMPLDMPGIAVLGLLLAALTLGLNGIEANRLAASLASVRVWPFLAGAVVLIPVFIRIERRATDPLLRLELFKNKQVVIAGMFAVGAGLTEAAFIFLPLLAVAAFDVSKSVASRMLVPLTLAVFIGSPLGGRMIDRVGSRVMARVGTVCLAAGMLMLGLYGSIRWGFYTGSVIIGMGLAALLGSTISYILLNASRAEERTVTLGISPLFKSIGRLTGAALIGAVAASSADPVDGYGTAFFIIAAVAFVLVGLTFGLYRRATELSHAHPAD